MQRFATCELNSRGFVARLRHGWASLHQNEETKRFEAC